MTGRFDRLTRHLLPVLVLSASLWLPASAAAQIPVPSGPLTFCGAQAPPVADTYTVAVDGVVVATAPTFTPPVAACPTGATHSFQLPAALFTVGTHTVMVTAVNAIGSTVGPSFAVVVGVRPGTFTIVGVIPPGL